MFEDTETYRLARFSSASEAEIAGRCLADVGIDSTIETERDELEGDGAWDSAVFLVCRAADRIQATVALERARII
jgi:hypothetical protein